MTPQQLLISACAAFLMSAPTGDQLSNVVRNLEAFASASAVTSQPAPYLWVAPNGSDTTGARGNIGAPFATVGAAIRAAQDGDTVLIAPGTYPAVGPTDFPVAVVNLTLLGMGSPQTCILSSANSAAFNVSAGLAAESITVRNLGFVTTNPGSSAFIAVGPGVGIPNNSRITAQNCTFSAPLAPAFIATNLLAAVLEGCSGSVQVTDCNGGLCEGHKAGDVTVNVADPVPAHVTRDVFRVQGSTPGIVSATGQAFLDVDAATSAFALSAGTIMVPLGDTASIAFHGRAATASLFPSGTGAVVLDLQNAQIPVLQSSSQVPAASTQRIDARGATIGRANLQSPGGGDLVLDTRGGFLGLGGDTIFGANTYWDRFGGGAASIALANGANALAFGVAFSEPAFPPGVSVAYTVTPATLGTLATDQLAVTAASNTGCTIASGYAAPINGRVLWHRQNY